MDKSDYLTKTQQLIHGDQYKMIKRDSAKKKFKSVKSAIKYPSPLISNSAKSALFPSVSNCARFYAYIKASCDKSKQALPKVHNFGIPLKMITSNIGTSLIISFRFSLHYSPTIYTIVKTPMSLLINFAISLLSLFSLFFTK